MNRSAVWALLLLTTALAGCDSAPPPVTALPSSPGPVVSSAPPSVAAAPVRKPKVAKATLAYFTDIALGAEYGDDIRVVTKWADAVVDVHVDGKVTAASRNCLRKVVTDFNALTTTTDLRLVDDPAGADIKLHFAPVTRFRSLDKRYVQGNDGFFSVNWRGDHSISDATVLIRTTGISDQIRCHLIREELTQSMGLMRDSNEHPDSVFFGRYYSAPIRYSALDKKIIALLYSDAIRPGDDRKAVTRAVTIG